MNKYIIFMLDDDIMILDAYQHLFQKLLPECITYTFNNSNEMLNHRKLQHVDLFIIDVELKHMYGWDVMNLVCKKRNKCSTCLFISGKEYELKNFDCVACTFDFIKKPANTTIFINRIKVLLQVSSKYKQLEFGKQQVELCLYELFNHTNIYVVILDELMSIKLCSWYLAHDLGYDSPEDLIGQNLKTFIPEHTQNRIDNIFSNIIKKINKAEDFREVNHPIIGKNNEEINVKWFNTIIRNGVELTFSIGIPLSKSVTKEDNVSTIRTYWSDIIESDRTTIDSLKNLLKTTPQQE